MTSADAYLYIFVAGSLCTVVWRWIGVGIGERLNEESLVFQWVRLVATALIGAVIGKLIAFPSGALVGVPLWVRIAALVVGLTVYLVLRRNLLVGILAGEAVLVAGILLI